MWSHGSFAVITIGYFDFLMSASRVDSPPLSRVPESPSTSSISMSLFVPKRLVWLTAVPMRCSMAVLFLSSLALTSTSSMPNSSAIAWTLLVLQLPGGPWSSAAFFFCFAYVCMYSFSLITAVWGMLLLCLGACLEDRGRFMSMLVLA